MTVSLSKYLALTKLEKTFRVNDIKGRRASRFLRPGTKIRINETVSELSDRVVVDRVATFQLKKRACQQQRLPKAISTVCLRKKRKGKLTAKMRADIAKIRGNLNKKPSGALIAPGVTAADAKQMSDTELFELAINRGAKEIRHVSVIPRSALSGLAYGARPRLTTHKLNFNRRIRPFRPGDLRMRDGFRLPRGLVPSRERADPSDYEVRPLEPTINYPERHFLTGFTFGHEIMDVIEITLAKKTWLTDRYYVRLSYDFAAGFGLRVPFALKTVAQSAARGNVSRDSQRVQTISTRGPKNGRNISITGRVVDVDRFGRHSYPEAGLPSTQTFSGTEFVLTVRANCSFYPSIPGKDISYGCPRVNFDKSKNFDPVLGRQVSRLGEFWLFGHETEFGYRLTSSNDGAWIGVGARAEITKGRLGFKLTPLDSSMFKTIRTGYHWINSSNPLIFTLAHSDYQNSRVTDMIGFKISDPVYKFRAQITPVARVRLVLDLGVYELRETIGPFALDFLQIGTDFKLGRHHSTTKSYQFKM